MCFWGTEFGGDNQPMWTAAFLPVLMVPVLAGVVTFGEALRKGLALFGTLSFALAAGLCASAARQERFRASRGAVLIVVLVVLVPFLPFATLPSGVAHWAGLLSPLALLISAEDISYLGSPAFYWVSLGVVHALAALLLVVAGIGLRRNVSGPGLEVARPSVSPGEAERAVGLYRWQPTRAEASPLEWLVHRQHGVSAGQWVLAVTVLAYSGVVFWAHQPFAVLGPSSSWVFSWPLGMAGGLIGGGMVAWVASRFFVGVRRTGDLELLLTTPLGAQNIVSEQSKVLNRFFVWTVPPCRRGCFCWPWARPSQRAAARSRDGERIIQY